jgi:hypothetical protein
MIIQRKTLYLDISQPRTENIYVNQRDINSRFYKIYLSNDGERLRLPSDSQITPFVKGCTDDVGSCEPNTDGSFNFDFNVENLDCCHCLLQFKFETQDSGIFHTYLIDVSIGVTIN